MIKNYYMEKLKFSININASREKVWQILWNKDSYKKWTSAFSESSDVRTDDWKEGSKVLFVDASGNGMISMVASNRPNEYMSFKHLGEVHDKVEDTTSEKVKMWSGSEENYTLKESNGGTELLVEIDIPAAFKDMFEQMWPKALQIVKDLAETKRKSITVVATINASIEKVWECWNEPKHITAWCYASDDWHAPHSENDLQPGGQIKTTMAAKDGSVSFDFIGTYTKVGKHHAIEYDIADGRHVSIRFEELPGQQVKVTETFEMETVHPEEIQRAGWQAILDNFKKYTETI
jgi:uncharacterized protein YndB with AHSA1/START domain